MTLRMEEVAGVVSRRSLLVGAAATAGLASVSRVVRAAQATAKAEELLQTEAAALSLPARDHYEQAHRRTNEALGDAAPAVAASGRALTLEQALMEAETVLELDRDEGADVTPVPEGG